MSFNQALQSLLAPAYAPCEKFTGACSEMRWQPEAGHVPRGFLGSTGSLEEVELVLVFAEPGDPHENEKHKDMHSAHAYAKSCYASGKDLFHRNVRKILKDCWPNDSFEEQLRKVWLTESVLCSARKECGPVSSKAARACGELYLLKQLELFPNALVVALGGKAQRRLRAIGFTNFLAVFAAAPPGCNRIKAAATWAQIPLRLHERFQPSA